MSLRLTSPVFEDHDALPHRYARGGSNCSPPLRWSGVPRGCAELALLCEDLDAAPGTSVHWIVFGIPVGMTELEEAVPVGPELPWGGRQGQNSFGQTGYTGPGPRGGNTHRYQFTLFALDARPPSLPAGASKREFLRALNGTVLARTHLTGTCFGRPKLKVKSRKRRDSPASLIGD